MFKQQLSTDTVLCGCMSVCSCVVCVFVLVGVRL